MVYGNPKFRFAQIVSASPTLDVAPPDPSSPPGFPSPELCSGLPVVGAGAIAGTRKRARSVRPGLSRQSPSVLMEMHASQEERERARAQQKNDYEGSSRGGLPHGFGTKIYTIEQSWQGLGMCKRRKACRALSAPAYRRRRGCGWTCTCLGFMRRLCACIDAHKIAHPHMRHDWIPACVLTHAMHLCWGFCLRQRRAPLAVRANFSNRRRIWAGLYHLGSTKPRFFCPCSFLRACSKWGPTFPCAL
jgi:hypothetical protein